MISCTKYVGCLQCTNCTQCKVQYSTNTVQYEYQYLYGSKINLQFISISGNVRVDGLGEATSAIFSMGQTLLTQRSPISSFEPAADRRLTAGAVAGATGTTGDKPSAGGAPGGPALAVAGAVTLGTLDVPVVAVVTPGLVQSKRGRLGKQRPPGKACF